MITLLLPGESQMKVTVAPLAVALTLGLLFAAPRAAAEELPEAVPALTGASVGIAGELTLVRIATTGASAPTVSAFRLSGPERLVVDVRGATLDPTATVVPAGIVTAGAFTSTEDGAIRLTLDLATAVTWEVSESEGAVLVSLTAGAAADPLAAALGASSAGSDLRLSGPATINGTAALTSLDFQQRDRTSRVVVGWRGVRPQVTEPERDVLAVDLPGATMPESLRRELDTRFFYSAVDSVRASSTRAGVRVTVRLRQGAEYTVKEEGGLYVLEVQVPADVRAPVAASLQSVDPAAPSTPKSSGTAPRGNASGAEELITGQGVSVDPQATLGRGTGAGSYSFATDMRRSSSQRSSGRRMSIDLQEADIHTVFRFIADFAEVNIIASDDVKGKVTVRLKDVPWDEALGAVLQAKGLGAQQFGDIIRVAPIETIKAEQQAALDAKEAERKLQDLAVYVAPLNYAQADELVDQVKSILSDRGDVQVDTRGNQLIVRDLEMKVAQVRALLARLDRPNREVDIEARFVEASSSMTNNLGIQWGSELNASSSTGYPTGAFFPSSVRANGALDQQGATAFYAPGADNLLVDMAADGAKSGIAFSLGSIPGLIDITARLTALEQEGYGKVISNPHVRTLDNETARVSQGARVPFVSVSNGGTQVQFVNAELELSVTPHITADGTIFLDVNLTNNRADFSNTVQGNPAIQTKEIETRVLVADGDTAVLGGVYYTIESSTQTRVPLLGRIPILGWLFKSTSKKKEQNEMLVFITPRIVPVKEDE